MDWQSLIPTVVGGLLALSGGLLQQNRANKIGEKVRIEQETKRKEEEVRQDKIQIIKDITGNKMVIAGADADKNSKTIFNSALNLIPIIFRDNKEIIEKHEELYHQITITGSNRDDVFYDLIVLLHKDVGFIPPTREQFIKTFII